MRRLYSCNAFIHGNTQRLIKFIQERKCDALCSFERVLGFQLHSSTLSKKINNLTC
jgi:hypothetical protein